MDATHLHLMLNHLPILGVPFGLALLVAGVLRSSEELKKAALVAFVLSWAAVVPVYLTGEPAEETVESLPGVQESLVETHEHAAPFALAATSLLGVLSLASLLLFGKSDLPASAAAALIVLALLSAGALAYTGWTGGHIRHTELHAQPAVPAYHHDD